MTLQSIGKPHHKTSFNEVVETINIPTKIAAAEFALMNFCGTCYKSNATISCKCHKIKYCNSNCRIQRPLSHRNHCVRHLTIDNDAKLLTPIAIFFQEVKKFKIKRFHFNYSMDDSNSPEKRFSIIYNPPLSKDPKRRTLKINDLNSLTFKILNAERILATDRTTPPSLVELI